MSRVKLSSATPDEINVFAETLRQAGYLVVQVSPYEFEVRPPIPEHIATARLSPLVDLDATSDLSQLVKESLPELQEKLEAEEAEAEEVAPVQIEAAEDTLAEEVYELSEEQESVSEPGVLAETASYQVQREFILAPLFRRIAELLPRPRVKTHVAAASSTVRDASRSFASSLANGIAQSWRKLALAERWHQFAGRWKKIEDDFASQQRNVASKVRAAMTPEPKQVRLFVVPGRRIDRIGWMMVAAVGVSLLIVVAMRVNAGHPDSPVKQMQVSMPASSTVTPVAEVQPVPVDVKPSAAKATVKKSARAHARKQYNTVEIDGDQDDGVVIKHFAQKKPHYGPQVRQVAGVKHFSDLDE